LVLCHSWLTGGYLNNHFHQLQPTLYREVPALTDLVYHLLTTRSRIQLPGGKRILYASPNRWLEATPSPSGERRH
jgi:hypothetical protein